MAQSFVGEYVGELTEVLISSAVSRANVMVIGRPGTGKSSLLSAVAEDIAGGTDRVPLLEFEASSPPEMVRGGYDNQIFLKTGKLVRNPIGTAHDPNARIVIADELPRANDPVWDAMIHAINAPRTALQDRPIFWATGNFSPTSTRTEAFRERFPLWFHVKATPEDLKKVLHLQTSILDDPPDPPEGLPDWQMVEQIRQAKPGPNASKAIEALVSDLLNEIYQGSVDGITFDVSPRHTGAWARILFRTGLFYSGDPDFSVIPVKASKMLQYAYPTVDEKTVNAWRNVVTAVSDVVGAKIAALKEAAYASFQQIQQNGSSMNRVQLTMALGAALQDHIKEIDSLGEDDLRVMTTIEEIQDVYAKLCRGENPFA